MKRYFKGLLMAISMFTIIPLPNYIWDDEGGKNIMKFYPVVGFIVGLVWYLVTKILLESEVATIIVSAVALITPFLLTGMLHLDGYMDVCDALLSRRDKKEKIRILKDPNTGAFAVISVLMLFIINFATVYTVVRLNSNLEILILIPMLSRSLMGYLLLSKKSMEGSSLGAFFKKGTTIIDKIILLVFLAIASVCMIMIMGTKGVLISLSMIILGLLSVNKCIKEFDGMAGDAAGYGLVLAEAIGVFILAIV